MDTRRQEIIEEYILNRSKETRILAIQAYYFELNKGEGMNYDCPYQNFMREVDNSCPCHILREKYKKEIEALIEAKEPKTEASDE